MGTRTAKKEQIIQILDNLPPEGLSEVQQFLDFLCFKQGVQLYQPPVALGGILKGYRFTRQDIARARTEMWSRFSDIQQ